MFEHKKLGDKLPEYVLTIKRSPINFKTMFKRRKEQHESVEFRHEIIQANERQNYINEYDRINSMLSNNIAHGHVSAAYLTNR